MEKDNFAEILREWTGNISMNLLNFCDPIIQYSKRVLKFPNSQIPKFLNSKGDISILAKQLPKFLGSYIPSIEYVKI